MKIWRGEWVRHRETETQRDRDTERESEREREGERGRGRRVTENGRTGYTSRGVQISLSLSLFLFPFLPLLLTSFLYLSTHLTIITSTSFAPSISFTSPLQVFYMILNYEVFFVSFHFRCTPDVIKY